MGNNAKKIVLILIAVVVLGILLRNCGGGHLKIREIKDGNTVALNNGVSVRLIGVSNTEESKDYLATIRNQIVRLVPDSRSRFDNKHFSGKELVYAYVQVGKKQRRCINAELLLRGKSLLVEDGYLNDSLDVFRKYAQKGEQEPDRVTPTPIISKIDYDQDSIKLPQYTPYNERRYQFWSSIPEENIDMCKEACDYNLPYTKMFANDLAGRAPGEFSIEQVCEIFDYCYQKWRYVNDPSGQEYVARASESINCSLAGDCDDFAVLMASCVLACGGNACIVSAYGPRGGHAYPEVDINSFKNCSESHIRDVISDRFAIYSPKNLHIREDGSHRWLNLDWQAAYPGGPYYDANRITYYSCVMGEWQCR